MTERPPEKHSEEDRDYYRVLSDVMDDQKQREQRRSKSAVRRASGSNSTVPGIVAMVCGVLSVYFWTSPPDFIKPDPIPGHSVESLEAGARMALYMQARQINLFVQQNNRLPTSLEESGRVIDSDITFERVGVGVFQVSMFYDQTTQLIYRSDQNLLEFRGNAMDIVNGRVDAPPGGGS